MHLWLILDHFLPRSLSSWACSAGDMHKRGTLAVTVLTHSHSKKYLDPVHTIRLIGFPCITTSSLPFSSEIKPITQNLLPPRSSLPPTGAGLICFALPKSKQEAVHLLCYPLSSLLPPVVGPWDEGAREGTCPSLPAWKKLPMQQLPTALLLSPVPSSHGLF